MLCQMIDEYLKNRPRGPRKKKCFHPSSLHKPAREMHQMFFNGDSKSFPPKVLRIFDNGHAVHQRLQEYLQGIGVLLQVEVPVSNTEYQIEGTCDGIIKIGDKKGVLEIKSINQNQFYALHEPKEEHLVQLHVYMFCAELERGVLLYECKDNQELKNFFVKLDSEILDPVLEKIKTVQEWIREGEDNASKR